MNVKKCVRALLCLYLTLIISIDAVKAQALKVGDTLPAELWNMPLQVINHPESKETITLSEYKDKLIILDFWATWCAPCIKSLTKLDTLQKEFSEQLAVIPITYENAEKVLPFLTKRGYQLPSIINDSTLKKYFPHRSIPHQVWIREGKVLAVTGAGYSTSGNVTKVLEGQSLQVEETHEDREGYELYSSFISTYSGKKGAMSKIGKNDLHVNNHSVADIYVELFQDIIHWSGRYNRVIAEIPDSIFFKIFQPSDYLPGRGHPENLSYHKWKIDNTYCYSLQLPKNQDLSRMLTLARANINDFFSTQLGVFAQIEKRMVRCLVVVDTNPKVKRNSEDLPQAYRIDESNGKVTFENMSFSHFFGVFQELNWVQSMPVIDSTGYQGRISMEFDCKLTELQNVRRILQKYGFDLIEKELDLDMLVIKTI